MDRDASTPDSALEALSTPGQDSATDASGDASAHPAGAVDRAQPVEAAPTALQPPLLGRDEGRKDSTPEVTGRGKDWAQRVAEMDEASVRRLVMLLPLIEQAKGVLMGFYGCDADRAFTILQRWSSVHHIKLRDLAARIVAHTETTAPDQTSTNECGDEWRPFAAVRMFVDQTDVK